MTDQLTRLGVQHTRISIHGGSTVGRLDDGTLSVPKRDLIAALVVGFESKRLRIAKGLRHIEHLEREAAAFQMKVSASGHDSYNAQERRARRFAVGGGAARLAGGAAEARWRGSSSPATSRRHPLSPAALEPRGGAQGSRRGVGVQVSRNDGR